MKKKDQLYSFVSFIYYYVYISIVFFMSPFLIDKGLSPTKIAFTSSISIFILVAALLLGGVLSDLKLKNKTIIITNLLFTLGSFYSLLVFSNKNILLISYLLLLSNFMMIPALLDGLVIKETKRINVVRAIGSLGAAFSYFVNYWVLDGIGLYPLFKCDIGLLIILIISLALIKETSYKKKNDYNLNKIIKDKFIVKILIISFLSYGVLVADDPYSVIYNTEIASISSKINGITSFLSIIVEIILILLIYKLLKKFKIKSLLYIAALNLALVFILKSSFYSFSSVIIFSNIVMGLFTGIFIPVILVIVNKYVDVEIRNSVLSIYLIFVKLGGALIGLITTYVFIKTDFLPSIYMLHFVLIIIALKIISTLKEIK